MITLSNIYKSYGKHSILSDFSLQIDENEFIVINGVSGCGKTTLLNIMALISKADKGDIEIAGIVNPAKREVQKLRRFQLGYVFQNYALLQNESVEENLKISKAYASGWDKQHIIRCLDMVGLNEVILSQKVFELSGGEQQRVAIARTLLKPAQIILADEPTGNLDAKNSKKIIDIFLDLKKQGKTIVCVTHETIFSQYADRCINL